MKGMLTPAQLAIGMALVGLAAGSTGAAADQIHPSKEVTQAINAAIHSGHIENGGTIEAKQGNSDDKGKK